jgi:hypothetical protein
MQDELINGFVDRNKFKADKDLVVNGLKDMYDQYMRVKNIKINLESDKSFKQVADDIRKLKKEEEDLIKISKEMDAAQKRLIQLQIEDEKLKQQKLKTMKQEQQATDQSNKQKATEAKLVSELSNDWKQYQKALSDAEAKVRALALQMGSSHPVVLQAINDYNQLRQVQVELNQKMGNYRDNVGNYASGWMSFNNIIRETPNFAISATTGIQALSNNIPMFADEISKARKEGTSWMGILKQLGANLFSFGGIATLATIALTALPKILEAMTTRTKESADAMNLKARSVGLAKQEIDKLKEVTENYNEALNTNNENAEKEITNLRILEKVATDTSKSMDVRIAAVKRLQELYPAYLGNLSKEEILSGKAALAINEITAALYKKAIAEAASSRSADAAKNVLDLKKEENTLLKEEQKLRENLNKEKNNRGRQGATGGSTTGVTSAELDGYDKLLAKLTGVKDRIEQNRLGQLTFGRDIQFYNDEAAKLYDQYYKLDEKKTDTTKKGVKKSKDALEEERKFAFEISKMILQDRMQQLEKIASDEKNSFGLRNVAYSEYLKVQQSLVKLQTDFELKELEEREKKIQNSKLSKKEKLAEESLIGKERLKISVENNLALVRNERDFYEKVNLLREEYGKRAIEAEKRAQEEKKKSDEAAEKSRLDRIDQFEKKIADRSSRTQEQLYTELNALAQSYMNGDIVSHEEYQKQKDQVTLKYTKKSIEDQIAAIKLVLGLKILSADEEQKKLTEVRELENRLNNQSVDDAQTTAKKKISIYQEYAQAANNILRETVTLAGSIGEAGFIKDKNAIQEQINLLESKKQKEIEVANQTITNEQDKAAAITTINARAAAQREQLEMKQRRIEEQRARFEKAMTIASLFQATSLAVLNTLKDPKLIALGINVPMAYAAGVIGALQIASVLVRPIPKFKDGTKNSPEGLAIVGDGGRPEVVETPGGKTYLTPATDTLTYLQKGSKVYSSIEAYKKTYPPGYSKAVPELDPMVLDQGKHFKQLSDTIDKRFQSLERVVAGKKELHLNTRKGDVEVLIKEAGRTLVYLNSETQF